jgi:hypothetical protein
MALGERSHLASIDMVLHLRISAHKFADCRTVHIELGEGKRD